MKEYRFEKDTDGVAAPCSTVNSIASEEPRTLRMEVRAPTLGGKFKLIFAGNTCDLNVNWEVIKNHRREEPSHAPDYGPETDVCEPKRYRRF